MLGQTQCLRGVPEKVHVEVVAGPASREEPTPPAASSKARHLVMVPHLGTWVNAETTTPATALLVGWLLSTPSNNHQRTTGDVSAGQSLARRGIAPDTAGPSKNHRRAQTQNGT